MICALIPPFCSNMIEFQCTTIMQTYCSSYSARLHSTYQLNSLTNTPQGCTKEKEDRVSKYFTGLFFLKKLLEKF